jgi:hypothetical protein
VAIAYVIVAWIVVEVSSVLFPGMLLPDWSVRLVPAGNLYGGDNQYGRTQKFVPRSGVDPALLINPPWRGR